MASPDIFFFSVPASIAPLAIELRGKMKRSAIKSRKPIGQIFIEIAAESEKLRDKAAEMLEKFPEGGDGEGRKRIAIGVPVDARDEIAEARERVALLGCDLYTTAGKAFVALVAAYYADKS